MNEERWTVEFYRDTRGGSPVQEFLDELDEDMRAKVTRSLILLSEQGDRLGMPLARPVAGYRFRELRVQMSGNAVRVFHFATSGRRIVLLHGFMKKSQKTPLRELQIAANRYSEYVRR